MIVSFYFVLFYSFEVEEMVVSLYVDDTEWPVLETVLKVSLHTRFSMLVILFFFIFLKKVFNVSLLKMHSPSMKKK